MAWRPGASRPAGAGRRRVAAESPARARVCRSSWPALVVCAAEGYGNSTRARVPPQRRLMQRETLERASIRFHVSAVRLRRKCRYRTGSRRSASSSRSPGAAWSTGTVAASTTRPGASVDATTASAGLPAGSVPRLAARPLLQPGRFTELFFLDDATALAAGHRPCALCRREDYARLGAIWASSTPARSEPTRSTRSCTRSVSRPERARIAATRRRSTSSPAARSSCERASPVSCSAGICCVDGGGLRAYRRRPARQAGAADHAPSLVEVLRVGWQPLVPLLHPSALVSEPDRP